MSGHDYRALDSREVYDGAIVRLRVDTVEMPGGSTAEREVVEHHDAVAVVALDESGAVTLVRQYRYPLGERLLELPAGLCDVDGEEVRATAERELREETGLAAETWRPLVRFSTSPGFSTERVQVFLATGISEVERPDGADDEESEIELVRVPLAEAVDDVLAGRITNGIAVAGLLAAREVLRRG